MRKNRVTLIALLLVFVLAGVVIVDRFADPSTKGRLYGWTGAGPGVGQPAAPSAPR